MKILLIGERLKFRSFSGANKALPVLASSLHNNGFTDVVQLDLERPDIKLEDVFNHAQDAALVAFAGTLTPQWPEIDEDGRLIHEHLTKIGRADIPVLVGGYAVKGAEDILRESPWISALFDGEGEEGIVEIARLLEAKRFLQNGENPKGLCFISPGGKFHASTAPRVKNLDDIDQHLNFTHVPAVHDMDIFSVPETGQLKTAQLFTQRGCPWVCGYCNKSTEGNGVVRLSEASLRRQLRHLKQQGYQAVYLDVDTFTVSEAAARREASIIREEGFFWGSNTRIDKITQELMLHFAQNDCIYMFFGVEHILPEVLVAIGKFNGPLQSQLNQAGQYPAKVRQIFKEMAVTGLPSSYFLILGLPKSVFSSEGKLMNYQPTTFEDDLMSVEFGLNECEPDFINFNMLRFMPGSVAADVPSHPAYSCVRPSGERPITAGFFLPRVARAMNYQLPEHHGIYRICESVGSNQPRSTAIDPQRVYDIIRSTIKIINRRIDCGRKPTKIVLDREIASSGLVKVQESGKYQIAPLDEFEAL